MQYRAMTLTNGFHLAMRVYSDDAQMMLKSGKNNEVCQKLQVSSMSVPCPNHVLTSSLCYESTHPWPNGIYVFYVHVLHCFVIGYSAQNTKCL